MTDNGGKRFDKGKLRMDLIPPEADKALAEILTMGAEKYGERNWERGMDYSRVVASLKRHLLAWELGSKLDSESGLSHMKHAMWNAMCLAVFEERGIGVNDIPGMSELTETDEEPIL